MRHYNIFDHTADLGVDVFGETQADLFRQAALALFDLLIEAFDVQASASPEVRGLAITGADSADLFVNFLREVLYLFNGDRLVLKDCRIGRVDETQLTAEIRCDRFDASRYRVRTEIKAVTYHQASVRKTENGWMGRVIFDV